MFQIDEKVVKDSRTLITIQGKKHEIEHLTKNGTINYTMFDDNLWLTTPKIRKAYIQRNDIANLYDKIVIARNGEDIDANYNFLEQITFKDNVDIKKDLVVRGNLTVEGTSTIIDTPSLSIEDNIIELNKNEIGDGISLKLSGTAINRGNKDFSRFLYSENDKAFVLDSSTRIDGEIDPEHWVVKGYTETNGEYEPGEFRARHKLTAPFARITDTLNVESLANFNHLVANGTVNLNYETIAAEMTVNGDFNANTTSNFHGLLTANRVAVFNDNIKANSILSVKGTSSFDSLSTFNKGIEVTADGADITGPTNITGSLAVSENVNIKKDLTVEGNLMSSDITSTDTITTENLIVNEDATINRNLVVDGSLEVNSNSVMNGGTEINDSLTVSCESNFNNNVNIKDNLNIRGQLNTKDNSIFEKSVNIKEDLTVEGNTNINGSISTDEDITASNINVKNNLKFEEGNGKGITFRNDENFKMYTSASSESNYGGRLDTTSDYNMYFRVANGINRGFVFKNGNDPLFQIEGNGQVRVKDKIISKGYDVITRENEGHKESGVGINADKLDDLHATDFLRRNVDTNTDAQITFTSEGKAINFNNKASLYYNNGVTVRTSSSTENSFKILSQDYNKILEVSDNTITYKSLPIWHKGNQGHESELDADTIDGLHGTDIALVDHLHDDRYIKNDEVDLKGKYRIEYDEEFDCLDFMYIGDKA